MSLWIGLFEVVPTSNDAPADVGGGFLHAVAEAMNASIFEERVLARLRPEFQIVACEDVELVAQRFRGVAVPLEIRQLISRAKKSGDVQISTVYGYPDDT